MKKVTTEEKWVQVITEEAELRGFPAHRMAQERAETEGRGAGERPRGPWVAGRAGRAPDCGAGGSGGKAECLLSQRAGRR